MKQDVWLTVRGEQYWDGADPNETELATAGTLEAIPDGWRFAYDETELTGMAGTHTEFTVQQNRVTLTRSGSVSSQMIFEEGARHTSFYELPFGALNVTVHTRRILSRITASGGLLEIRYAIAVEGENMGENCFKIRIKTKDRGLTT